MDIKEINLSISFLRIFYYVNAPLYFEISKGGMTLRLTEHHREYSPATKIFIHCKGLKEYHENLKKREHKYNNPDIGKAPWKDLCA